MVYFLYPVELIISLNVLVLFSGGPDSTYLINHYLKIGFDVTLLWINYGQIASDKELVAAQNISEFFELKLNIIKTGFKIILSPNGEYIGRNLLLISTALSTSLIDCGLIGIGIRENNYYSDCTTRFKTIVSRLVIELTNGKFEVDMPLFQISKRKTFAFLKENGVPVEFTRSCDKDTTLPCNECNSCIERNTLGEENEISS